MEDFNQALFLYLNADLTTPPWIITIASVIADYVILFVPLTLVMLWYRGDTPTRNLALKSTAVTLTALGMNQLIIAYWPHPRPFMIGLGHRFIPHAADASFPSDHGTVFAAIALTFLLSSVWSLTGWIVAVAGTLVAWSRIFLGVHFPLDMLGAVVVSGLAWVGVKLIWSRVGDQITQWCEQIYRAVFAPLISRGWIHS